MSNLDKLVSIVVPIYNREKFLDKCITSLIDQSYKNIEILLIDDGSTDKSLDICNSFAKKDDRIKVIHKENGGVQSARNRGIDEATGYYLTFTDADDYVSKDYIGNFINVINNDKAIGDLECVVCGHYRVNQDGKILNANEYTTNMDIPKHECERWALYFERFGCYCWNHLFITDIVKENNIRFDKDILIFDDTAFTMSYLRYINKIGFTNSNDYYYVCEHNELTVAKRLENRRVNDGGCREKAKTCIEIYNRYKKLQYDDEFKCDWKWFSSTLKFVTIISFILYISRVPFDYRYSTEIKNEQFDDFYNFFKSQNINEWHYSDKDLHIKFNSIPLYNITCFFFFHCAKQIFRIFCDLFGCDFASKIFLYIKFKRH